jgi:POT family proton-dependent oligopeptide transporter
MSGLMKSLGLAVVILLLGVAVLVFGFWLSAILLAATVIGLQCAIWIQRARGQKELFGHPLPLFMLFLVEMWERFSYYGMRAIFMLYMTNYLVLESGFKSSIYGNYTGLVYLTTIIGGFVADRYLGLQKTILIGGSMMAAGQFLLTTHAWGGPGMGPQAAESLSMLFLGLFLLVFGNGMFKANISTIVGQLYPAGDPRRDAGFTIFYMGINVGAFFSPIICGYLAQEVDWKWGFLAAGAGMLIGTLTFWFGKTMLGGLGIEPAGGHQSPSAAAAPTSLRALSGGELFASRILWVVAAASAIWGIKQWITSDAVQLLDRIDPLIWYTIAVPCAVAALSYLMPRCTKEEVGKISAIYVLAAFVMLFWAAFEQAGSSLTLFADQLTLNVFAGNEFPSSWWQSANAIFIIAFAPVVSSIWLLLSGVGKEPSTPMKMVWGILFNSASFAIMIPAAMVATADNKSAPIWLALLYFLQTLGELCLSPVGLSMVTKLAPARYGAMLMGIWFLIANAFGNRIAGQAGAWFEQYGATQLFVGVAIVLGVAALILLFLVPWLRKQMGNVR